MLVKYDLHVHSALSPCADDDMTPANIVGLAALSGLDMVAIADHNAIANVQVAVDIGNAYGVTVVPAMELQTAEDVHVLCLFKTVEDLDEFYKQIPFLPLENNAEIFGNQLIMDEDDNVIATESRLLLVASGVSVDQLPALCDRYGGVAVAAHIDREENGMVQILGSVTDGYAVVEYSSHATSLFRSHYSQYSYVVNSDAHTLGDIGKAGAAIELQHNSAECLIETLKASSKVL